MGEQSNIYYTYAYLRLDGTPYYVGKGKRRRAYESGNRHIKPPKDSDRILILKKNLTEEEAFTHEIYMIHILGRKDLGTGILRNRTNGGEGSSGRVLSAESLKKLSSSKKGAKVSEETRKKLSESLRGKNLGKKHSEETKKRMSQERKGRKIDPSTKEKMSLAHRGEKNPFYGKRHTLSSRLSMSENSKGEKNPNYGKPRPRDIVEKAAASNRGKKRSPEVCKKLSEVGKGRKRPQDVCKKISEAMSKRVKEKNPNYGKHWWHDKESGNTKFSLESPGPSWERGRGSTLKNKPKGEV